jgi:hypothetical protein
MAASLSMLDCCARAASGMAVETTIPVRKLRRRIAGSLPWGYADDGFQQPDYSRVLRPAKWGQGSVCTAAILRRSMSALGSFSTDPGSLACRFMSAPPRRRT